MYSTIFGCTYLGMCIRSPKWSLYQDEPATIQQLLMSWVQVIPEKLSFFCTSKLRYVKHERTKGDVAATERIYERTYRITIFSSLSSFPEPHVSYDKKNL